MEILLDSAIRDWVMIPVVVVMLLVGLLRNSLTRHFNSPTDSKPDDILATQVLLRTSRLRSHADFLPPRSAGQRVSYFCKSEGALHKSFEVEDMTNMMMNPMAMLGGLKRNMVYSVTMMLMLSWISQYCSGFILARVPFPLTQKFRSMLQRGVDLNALDVTYVSSTSWYFLVLFGLSGIYRLLDEGKREDVNPMTQMMPMMGAQPGKDWNKVFASERDSLELLKHKFVFESAEAKFLEA
jgi:hypothetical protein